MYGFGRPLQRLRALVLLQGFTWGVFAGRHQKVETLQVVEDVVSAEKDYFSQRWLEQYNGTKTGCKLGRGSYPWRGAGFGSNINSMLNIWVYFLAVKEWSDISLIIDDEQLQSLKCSNESAGLVSQGWGCLFSRMPHVCVFDTAEEWKRHMRWADVSHDDRHTAGTISHIPLRKNQRAIEIVDFLEHLDVDYLGALAVMAKYLWGYMAPWLRHDVDFVIHAEKPVQGSCFLGIHVRRGDKISQEADAIDVEEYLKAAVAYAERETSPTGVDDIEAIWVASDDATIVDEVRTLVPTYFPSVVSEAVVYVDSGVAGGSNTTGVATRTTTQDYGSFVYILADLEQLAAADVFVGTFSSNVGRLVALLREGLGKPRDSSISLDAAWRPGRQRSLLLE